MSHILKNSTGKIAVNGSYPSNLVKIATQTHEIPDVDIVGTEVLNHYSYLTDDFSIGDQIITVNDASSFAAGEIIMLIQMHIRRYMTDPTVYSPDPASSEYATVSRELGKYEINTIESIDGNSITLKYPLAKGYLSDSGTYQLENTRTQILNIPIYNNLNFASGTIAANGWDGYCGGIVALRANEINGTGTISAAGCGYRGGRYIGSWTTTLIGNNEGFIGNYLPVSAGSTEYPYYQGAGCWNEPYASASSGGHKNNGATSTYGGQPGGYAFGTPNLMETLTFGGGGSHGAGGQFAAQRPGGNGGGIIFIISNSISVNISLVATGNNGASYAGYGSGGGAGGSILCRKFIPGTSQYNVNGGTGVYGNASEGFKLGVNV